MSAYNSKARENYPDGVKGYNIYPPDEELRKATKQIGSVMVECLRCLKQYHGWHENGGWLWGSLSRTQETMDRLVKRGLATLGKTTFNNHPVPFYEISALGERYLDWLEEAKRIRREQTGH